MEQEQNPGVTNTEASSTSIAILDPSAVAESVQLEGDIPLVPEPAPVAATDAATHSVAQGSPQASLPPTPPNIENNVVWRGQFIWREQNFFDCTCTAVSGGPTVSNAGREMMTTVSDGEQSGSGDGGGSIYLIGLSDSCAVWEYVMELRDSWDEKVCMMVINKPEGGQLLDKYNECFTFCDKENQIGVLDFVDHPTIKDGYVFTLKAGEPLPHVDLLPLDGVGLPEWAQHTECILLMLVRRMDHEDEQWKRQRMGIDISSTPLIKKRRLSPVSSISKKIELVHCINSVLVYAQNINDNVVRANEGECKAHIENLLCIRRQLARLYRLGRMSPIGTSQNVSDESVNVED